MQKKLVIVLLVILIVFLLTSNILAASRTIFLDPAHGGSKVGFIFSEGKFEKDLNLNLALKMSKYFTDCILSRTDDRENLDGAKSIKITELNPDLFVCLHHHGKYAVHIEYNDMASTIAYQVGAYFASEDIPFKFVKYKKEWLFDLPLPVLVIIVNEEIADQTDWALIVKILEGLD